MPLTGDLLTETFDNTTDYDNAGWSVQGSVNPNYTTTVLEGTQSLFLDGNSAYSAINHTFTSQTTVYVYFQWRTAATLPSFQMIVKLADASETECARIFIKSDGSILVDSNGVFSSDSTTKVTTNTTYHFWLSYTKGTGANAAVTLGFSTTGIRPTSGGSYHSITNGAGTVNAEWIRCLAASETGWSCIFDQIVINTTQIGDAVPAVTVNLTGVGASPAVGTLTFNGTLNLTGVAASPAIGTGTVTTDTPATVTVNLTGVAATPSIGIGHVAIEGEVIAPPEQGLVAGGGRWYGLPEAAKVYLTGVAANPQVGKIAAKPRGTLDELYRMYPFPRKVEERPLPVVRKKAAKPPKPTAFVYMAGVHPTPRIGNVTTKAFYEDNDEELTSMLKMMDVDEDLITALKLSK